MPNCIRIPLSIAILVPPEGGKQKARARRGARRPQFVGCKVYSQVGNALEAWLIELIEASHTLGFEFRKSHHQAGNRRCFGAQNCVPERR
jgi:hypothetical protein